MGGRVESVGWLGAVLRDEDVPRRQMVRVVHSKDEARDAGAGYFTAVPARSGPAPSRMFIEGRLHHAVEPIPGLPPTYIRALP
jgi:hypothetical protein